MSPVNFGARPYLLMALSMAVFGTIGIFRRYIPVSSALLVFLRGILGALCMLCIMAMRKGKLWPSISRRNFWLLALGGFFLGGDWLLLFESYNHTTVPIATLCFYMAPTFVILVSPLIFHERLTIRKVLCALASIVGITFVSGVMDGGGFQPADLHGVVLGLLAAIMYAAVVVLNKMIPVTDAYQRVIIQLVFAALILSPYLLFTENFTGLQVSGFAILMILFVGIVHTGVTYAAYFDSMAKLPAQTVAMLSYIDPIVAVVCSAIFLGEQLTVWGLLGAVLIIGAAVISELPENVSRQ